MVRYRRYKYSGISHSMESYFEIAIAIANDMKKTDLEPLAVNCLAQQLMEDEDLYYKYYLRYKNTK